MADRDDLEFTYSLIDRVFRLSMGELADFSGAMYDGDFSLTLEEAQTRKHEYIVERLGIGPGRRILDLGCGWGPLLDVVRRREGRRRRGHALVGPGGGVPSQRSRRPPVRRPAPHSRDLRSLRRGGESRRLRALLFAGGVPRRAPGVGLPRPLRRVASVLPDHGRFYLQTMVFGRNMIPLDDVDIDAPRESDAWYLALLGRQFPGSWLPMGLEQIVECAEPHFRLV